MDKYYLGIMTGTSVDGIDISAVRFSPDSDREIEIRSFDTYPFKPTLKNFLLSIYNSISPEYISQLNFAFSDAVAEAVNKHLKENDISKDEIEAIGFHGQTLWHQPDEKRFLNKNVTSSLQIGSGLHLAVKTGIKVINDFRTADISDGGQGAPLIPIFDYYFLRGKEDSIVLNIGGISNITYLPGNCSKSDVIAFDTGPGNMLIDIAMRKLFNMEYDSRGRIAKSGELNKELLNKLMDEKFILKKPPKSTGKELYNESYLKYNGAFDINHTDLICTLTHYTAKSIAVNIKKYCTDKKVKLKVSGGGLKNTFLIELLQSYLPNAEISSIILDNKDISDSREALLMAFLAYLRVNKIPGNLPSVTGAKSERLLGSISE